MIEMIKRVMNWGLDLLLTGLILILILPLAILPWKAACAVGRLYGWITFLIWAEARRVSMMNLRRAYGPTMTRLQARRMTLRVLQSLAQSVAEGVQFAFHHRRRGPLMGGIIEVADPLLDRRLREDDTPKILVTAHLGSWECLAGIVAARKSGMAVVRRIDNRFLDKLVHIFRIAGQHPRIEKRGAAEKCLEALRQGQSVGMMGDENGGYKGIFVKFWNRPASTQRTPALLALASGAPIVLAAAVRLPEGNLRVLLKVLDPAGYGHGTEALHRLTQDMTGVLEAWIREYPEQWRWVHWRWKTRPDGTEETYRRRDLKRCFEEVTLPEGSPGRDFGIAAKGGEHGSP